MNNGVPTRYSLTNALKHLPIVIVAFAVVTILVLIAFDSLSLIKRGSLYILPAVLLLLVYFQRRKIGVVRIVSLTVLIKLNNGLFARLTGLNILVQLISIIAVVLYPQQRPVLYFVFIIMAVIITIIQIMSVTRDDKSKRAIIIIETMALALNIMLCETLRYPLYFGTTDPIYHMSYISSVINLGHTSNFLADYEHFPLYQIFGASGVLTTGLDIKVIYFLLFSLSFIVTVPLVYLLVSKLTKDMQLSLFAMLLFGLSSEVLFAGMNGTVRAIAFVLLLFIIYLLITRRGNPIKTVLVIVFGIALTLTHPTTTVQGIMILTVLYIAERVFNKQARNFTFSYILFLVLINLSYWLYAADFVLARLSTVVTSFSELSALPDLSSIEKSLSASLIGGIEQAIIAFLAIVGIMSLANRAGEKDGYLLKPLIWFTLFGLLLYLDTPLQYLAYIFLTARLPLMVAPFIFLAVAEGLLTIVSKRATKNNCNRPASSFIPALTTSLILVLFGLSSVLGLANSTDRDFSSVLGAENRRYFIESEIFAFNFVAESLSENDHVVYSDWQSQRYLSGLLDLNSTSVYSNVQNGVNEQQQVYVLRDLEALEKGQLRFLDFPENAGRAVGIIVPTDELFNNGFVHYSKIYVNSSTSVYVKT
ncbi:hypothetical protein DGWBC_0902 [Dehalogenimonas sp. WBC-2]|nr:hypothetical protein DGWBC_0902 [Dehalogenimonas sp. WBC-2]